jgi:hypothetical protein
MLPRLVARCGIRITRQLINNIPRRNPIQNAVELLIAEWRFGRSFHGVAPSTSLSFHININATHSLLSRTALTFQHRVAPDAALQLFVVAQGAANAI